MYKSLNENLTTPCIMMAVTTTYGKNIPDLDSQSWVDTEDDLPVWPFPTRRPPGESLTKI